LIIFQVELERRLEASNKSKAHYKSSSGGVLSRRTQNLKSLQMKKLKSLLRNKYR